MCLLCNEKGRRFRSLDACQKHMKDKAHCRVAHDGNAMLEYEEFYDYRYDIKQLNRSAVVHCIVFEL